MTYNLSKMVTLITLMSNTSGILYFPTHALVVTGKALTISVQTFTDTAHTSVAWYKDGVFMNPTDSDYTITTVSFCVTARDSDNTNKNCERYFPFASIR